MGKRRNAKIKQAGKEKDSSINSINSSRVTTVEITTVGITTVGTTTVGTTTVGTTTVGTTTVGIIIIFRGGEATIITMQVIIKIKAPAIILGIIMLVDGNRMIILAVAVEIITERITAIKINLHLTFLLL